MNVRVQIPAGLRAFADGRSELLTSGVDTVGALLVSLPAGIRERVLDERGRVRRHVNVFVGDTSIRETGGVDTPLRDGAEVWIIPAVSGGRTPHPSWPLDGEGVARRALAMALLRVPSCDADGADLRHAQRRPMNDHDLQAYLHERIPLSRAMGVVVTAAMPESVTLGAPLTPNINHRDTVFGGSASAVAMLSAWALLQVRLGAEAIPARVVIQHNEMTFERPIAGDFTSCATIRGNDAWRRFMDSLRRRGRGRVAVSVELACQGQRVATFEGDFVAVAT